VGTLLNPAKTASLLPNWPAAFVGPLLTSTPQPTATDAALALASPALPAAAPVLRVAPLAQKVALKAVASEAVATRVADTTTLDHLTLLLAMERSATELSAQRHLRALDAVLAEGTSVFADSPDVFATARPVRRKMTSM
jgi:hypothetical protein